MKILKIVFKINFYFHIKTNAPAGLAMSVIYVINKRYIRIPLSLKCILQPVTNPVESRVSYKIKKNHILLMYHLCLTKYSMENLMNKIVTILLV